MTNVLLIMSDQHHKGAMGCAGQGIVDTPHLDGLARRGTRFTSAYCNFPLCGPSRAAFMTGRHPYETEVWTNASEFRSDMPTWAHGFGAAGYETVLAGRMHFVGWDQRHGFQTRLLGDCPASSYIAGGWQLRDVLGDLVGTPGMSRTSLELSGPGRSGYLAYDEAVADATVAYLTQRPRDAERPLLLTVGFAMPHCPFVCEPADFERTFPQTPGPDYDEADLTGQHPWLLAQRQRYGSRPLPPPEVHRRVAAAYSGMVNHLDRQVGRVLAALRDSGLGQDTIVVYTSDHGEQLGEHGCWWKSTFYEGSVGVPLIVAQPGGEGGSESEARLCDRHVSLMDIGPTLLDLAGLEPLPGASGRSFRGPLEGDTSAWDNRVFAEYAESGHEGGIQRMVRRDEWKYVYHHGMRPQLYDLAADPAETNDLGDSADHAQVRAALQAEALADWDPTRVQDRLRTVNQELKLIGRWERQTGPPEPVPPWFTTPPDNWVGT